MAKILIVDDEPRIRELMMNAPASRNCCSRAGTTDAAAIVPVAKPSIRNSGVGTVSSRRRETPENSAI